MAKKPMTKSQIVSHFAGKFELTKKTASGIIDEVAALAVTEIKKAGSFTLPGIRKLVLVKRKARMGRVIRLLVRQSRFLLRLWSRCGGRKQLKKRLYGGGSREASLPLGKISWLSFSSRQG